MTQHFRVDVEKTSVLQDDNGDDIPMDHDFQPRFEPATMRHLGEATLNFVDETAVVISKQTLTARIRRSSPPSSLMAFRISKGPIRATSTLLVLKFLELT